MIDVTIADVPTLQRLLTFLYTCDYDDGSGSSLAIEQAKSESVVDPEKDKSRMPANERWVLSPPLDSSSDSTQPWSCGSDGGTDHAHEETLDKMNMNQALMANAQVYVAADYYQIPELMRLAVDKFRKRSMKFYQPGFADVVAFVFQCTPNLAPEMKNILGSTFLKNAVSLVSDTTFMDTGDRLSGFFKRALPLVVAAMSAH